MTHKVRKVPKCGLVQRKKNSDLSRRQTTMKSATDLPNGDLQHFCARWRFAQPKLSTVVGRIIDRLAHPRC
jgi:hypothetical protein